MMIFCIQRQPGDDEKMLFCDECDKGFHTYCLTPPMSSVPKTAWKCYVSLEISILITIFVKSLIYFRNLLIPRGNH